MSTFLPGKLTATISFTLVDKFIPISFTLVDKFILPTSRDEIQNFHHDFSQTLCVPCALLRIRVSPQNYYLVRLIKN
jgi:hypothetical protein